jgi:hypothetical protein
MAANSTLNISSLDFDTLKTNLKNFLRSQTSFRDYDFEGSNMNVLLDVLSYNSYLNSFYLNMAAAEGFLDSAQMRSSVISHAKELNYIPRSVRSAEALVDISFTTTGITNIFEIPKGTQFSGTNANGGFIFTTDRVHTLNSATSTFTITGLPIYEGTYINESFIVDTSIENQRFVISNKDVDTTSISVSLSTDGGQTAIDYTQATTLFGLKNTSTVYFVQATLDGNYEIVFGDGVFGTAPINNTILLITYRISHGAAGNGITTFFIDNDLGAYNGGTAVAVVSLNSASIDGAAVESIESVRFRAPRHFQTQDRAITSSDYQNLIYENFPIVKAVNVFGGETVTGSVEFGKVFISPISTSGASLTQTVKNEIINYLRGKNAIGITPIIVDPTILYIIPSLTVTVDFNQTTMSPADVVSLMITSMGTYNTDYLEDFNTTFRFSQFVGTLNNADTSILSVQASTVVKKIIAPQINKAQSISFSFNNELVPGTIVSSQFLRNDGYVYRLTDYNPNVSSFQRTGSITSYTVQNTTKVMYLQQILAGVENYFPTGSIDYTTGQIDITTLTVADFLGNAGIEFYSAIQADDIVGIKNDLIELDIANAQVTVVSA